MHPLFAQASEITHDVIGAAIEVHKDKGPGLLESIYEWCFTMELELPGHRVQNQDLVVIRYKQFRREEPLRFDLLVDKCLLVEDKEETETLCSAASVHSCSNVGAMDRKLDPVFPSLSLHFRRCDCFRLRSSKIAHAWRLRAIARHTNVQLIS